MERKIWLKLYVIFASIVILAVIVGPFILQSDIIGVSKTNIEKEDREAARISDDWQVAKQTTETMSALLFYDEDLSDHTFSIYINHDGFSFGYFFISGGSDSTMMERVAERHIDGYNECAYLSLNKQQVSKVEIDDGNTVETMNMDSTKPFVFILPVNTDVTMYDINGDVVESVETS